MALTSSEPVSMRAVEGLVSSVTAGVDDGCNDGFRGRGVPRSGCRAASPGPGADAAVPSCARAGDRVEGTVPVGTSCRIRQAHLEGAEVHLRLEGSADGPAGLVADHVLAATGYRLDVDALSFLAPQVRREVARVPGSKAPRLSRAFASHVPELYFTGSPAAPVFWPMLRFVAGTELAAGRITAALTCWPSHR